MVLCLNIKGTIFSHKRGEEVGVESDMQTINFAGTGLYSNGTQCGAVDLHGNFLAVLYSLNI